MNPYSSFVRTHPSRVLEGEILVFEGSFTVPSVSALSRYELANRLFAAQQLDQALEEAQQSATLNPLFRPG